MSAGVEGGGGGRVLTSEPVGGWSWVTRVEIMHSKNNIICILLKNIVSLF